MAAAAVARAVGTDPGAAVPHGRTARLHTSQLHRDGGVHAGARADNCAQDRVLHLFGTGLGPQRLPPHHPTLGRTHRTGSCRGHYGALLVRFHPRHTAGAGKAYNSEQPRTAPFDGRLPHCPHLRPARRNLSGVAASHAENHRRQRERAASRPYLLHRRPAEHASRRDSKRERAYQQPSLRSPRGVNSGQSRLRPSAGGYC